MIEVQDIQYTYANSPAIFQNFSLSIQRGEAWAVLGPSGCGKTTLLYLLAGLRFPTAGLVKINDQPISRPRPHSGLILQEYGLLPWATVRQNVTLGLRIRNYYGPDGKHAPSGALPTAAAQVDYWLERLGLTSQAEKYPGQLSGGQRQRTAIARTLVLQPDLLLMDEPFSSLDAPTRESLQALTVELQIEQGLTLVIVTHAIEEAAVLGRKILLLGRAPNTSPQIIENPGAAEVGFRTTPAYLALCQELRSRMEAA